ncbi:bifunctional DNA-formamidopyrimidine glycosylase/DNA-(apurinic or apyrimidinic site) lyase [Methylocella sp.]|uniref:bifunctional DNA-formamidopyrimidine glycosylase/DNA-(apurinic or apyrimidinic site) lyase n=1 Tax=Methylocella sp. TaxID=1978226 RepID=UPI003784C5B9
MPELPEVETVRRGLAPVMVGARILAVDQRRPNLRFPFPERFTERLSGRGVVALRRRAKYLLADLDDGAALVMHLGMSGSFRIEGHVDALNAEAQKLAPCGAPKDAAHDHAAFSLSNGARVVYNDPRRFGFMQLAAQAGLDAHPLFRGLGLEPLDGALDGAALARLFTGKSTSLKAALLDQRLVAGLGNIYVCEALHRAGLSPRRAAGTLARQSGGPTAGARRLAEAIRTVLEEAVAAGGSSLRDHRQADGSLGYFQHSFRAYGREGAPCPTPGCDGLIRRAAQGGRSTFYCAACQK